MLGGGVDRPLFLQVGGYQAVSGVRNQGECNACAVFAVIAAAEGAVASVTREDASGDFSEWLLLAGVTFQPAAAGAAAADVSL
jgi:C1A family cysteine protease